MLTGRLGGQLNSWMSAVLEMIGRSYIVSSEVSKPTTLPSATG